MVFLNISKENKDQKKQTVIFISNINHRVMLLMGITARNSTSVAPSLSEMILSMVSL